MLSENLNQLSWLNSLWQLLDKKNLVDAWLLRSASKPGIQLLIHHLRGLTSKLNQSINHLALYFYLSSLCVLQMPLRSLFRDLLIESSLKFGYEVWFFFREVQPHRLAIKWTSSQLLDCLLSTLAVGHDDVGLTALTDVLLGMNFVHFAMIAEQLKKRVFEVNKFDFLIQIVAVDRVARRQQFLILDAVKLLLEWVSNLRNYRFCH